MSTICAISTPLGVGGIAVIRISGEGALAAAERVFYPFADKAVSSMEGYTCAYGEVRDKDGRTVDDAVLTVFRAPKSYTGEDVCEISCHGGIYVTKKILRLCIEAGCEPAMAGEFTKRAFINGKLSLTQAEAVSDMLSAEGDYALSSAALARKGRLYADIKKISDSLIKSLGELAAWVDYPEEDIPEVDESELLETLKENRKALKRLLRDYDSGMIIKNGVDTVIAGKPNVGKSTLMNLLLGYDRSIVTDIAGTTRDVIEESVRLGAVTLRISDTAGIHGTDDTVEKMGVELAKSRLEECRLIIAVFDISSPLDDEDRELLDFIAGLKKKTVIVLNKTDKAQAADRTEFERYSDNIIAISAGSGEGREELSGMIETMFTPEDYNADSTVFANERQKMCAERALECIEDAVRALEAGLTLDAVTVTVDRAAEHLAELTGEKAGEAVVNEVFAKFCVGK
ncbi:tRNA uridine-5-carboxymethylaminomethyl(34) synthesis GTPase MnmE [Ruminococcus sp. NK3A76]|uniref:tRNA uridine-5-carboxymethylaminomethyl(34) synthesis GTPase MnmE n=1 Tax=Ruminococcus sp. NK3A76 TaxID=877411 RepID=UPI00048A89C5|nr:tRNA uridine-5-carboxymethylaminomethyl(34) synthesis GTPase MnmE [Ruminococcus sp. NK3A76]